MPAALSAATDTTCVPPENDLVRVAPAHGVFTPSTVQTNAAGVTVEVKAKVCSFSSTTEPSAGPPVMAVSALPGAGVGVAVGVGVGDVVGVGVGLGSGVAVSANDASLMSKK